jgi:Cu(I)/Ag(I) efflux system membrane protein CusA/SilA
MFETVINLKPQSEWRPGMTMDKLIAELDAALQFPGVANAWTMPIKARIDMLSTGIRTPIGIKVFGKDLDGIERVAREVESVVKNVPGTTSAYAERLTGGYYIEIEPDRMALARYGLSVGELQEVIATALGGDMVTTTVEGLERYGVVVRYPRDFRSDPAAIATQVLVPVMGGRTAADTGAAGSVMSGAGSRPPGAGPPRTLSGTMLPLGQLAGVKLAKGPPSIRTENALLVAYIYVDIRDRDIGGYVADAQKAVRENVKFPPGYYVTWSGQFEYMERAMEKLRIVVPLTILIIFVLLYLNFRRLAETLVVMLSVPFALVGGIWLMYLLGYNLSVAVAVGFIALLGVAAEIGVVILIYIDHALQGARARRGAAAEHLTIEDLHECVIQGALLRVRPIMMTVAAIVGGLLPIMWGSGTGSEVMRRIAAPMVGGMVSATILALLVIPAIYAVVKGVALRRAGDRHPETQAAG